MTYTSPNNLTGLVEMFTYVNEVTNNIFIIGLLITIYIVPFIYRLLRGGNWLEASMVSGFIVTISAILLRVSGLFTNDNYLFICIGSIVLPLIISWLIDKIT